MPGMVLIMVLANLGALARWPYSRTRGYYPTGAVGLMLLIILVLRVIGRI